MAAFGHHKEMPGQEPSARVDGGRAPGCAAGRTRRTREAPLRPSRGAVPAGPGVEDGPPLASPVRTATGPTASAARSADIDRQPRQPAGRRPGEGTERRTRPLLNRKAGPGHGRAQDGGPGIPSVLYPSAPHPKAEARPTRQRATRAAGPLPQEMVSQVPTGQVPTGQASPAVVRRGGPGRASARAPSRHSQT